MFIILRTTPNTNSQIYVHYSPDYSIWQQSNICSLFSGLLDMATVKYMFIILRTTRYGNSQIIIREYRRDNPEKPARKVWRYQRGNRNIGYTRRRQTKQKHNTICVGYHNAQTNTNNVNKTSALLQSTGDKDEPNMVLCGSRNGHHNTEHRT